ncbi:hypothetical protein E4U55_002932 [Claviceps digitariae]|nr:hypothetical protein E4U55_002932 [Claviceps digitariae]
MVMFDRGQNLPTSVFSPSSARIAASTAKDWSFIDSWLFKILPNEKWPNYERNSATLTALLTLASVNEVTTTDRNLLSAASNSALGMDNGAGFASTLTEETPQGHNGLASRKSILQEVRNYLTRDGQVALGALADTSVQHKACLSSPEDLAQEFISLNTSFCETEQMIKRISALNEHLILELQSSRAQLAVFESTVYSLPIEVPKQNLELQRKTRLKVKQMSDARERQKSLLSTPRLSCTIDLVLKGERQLIGLLTSSEKLASQIAVFRKLSSNPEKAKDQLGGFQEQLRQLMVHRDHVFEGLVEQASPLKHQ